MLLEHSEKLEWTLIVGLCRHLLFFLLLGLPFLRLAHRSITPHFHLTGSSPRNISARRPPKVTRLKASLTLQ
jgi:hypothetical protein